MKVMGPISQRVYEEASKQQGAQAGAQQGAPNAGKQASQENAGNNGDFVDADYKIVDE